MSSPCALAIASQTSCRQLEAEPGVVDVTFASRLPGERADGADRGRGERRAGRRQRQSTSGHAVRFGWVGIDFFEAFQIPILAGRRFGSGDLQPRWRRTDATRGGQARAPTLDASRVPTIRAGLARPSARATSGERLASPRATAIIVNRSFAQQIFGDGNVLGRRVRYRGASPELAGWYEIVGVVGDFPPSATELTSADARMYHPVTPAQIHPASVAVRVRGTTPASVGRKTPRDHHRDRSARCNWRGVLSLDQVYREEQRFVQLGALAFGIVTLSVLLLSAAGIYALMSFTVAQRRREIGIRAALGADPRRILAGIFARALASAGDRCGRRSRHGGADVRGDHAHSAVTSAHGVVLLPAVAVIMMAVGLVAAVGPARRGLRIDPTESLKADS